MEVERQDLIAIASGSLPLNLIISLLQAAASQGKQELETQQFKQAQRVLEARDRKLLDYLNTIDLSIEAISKIEFFISQENKAIAESIKNESNILHLTEAQLQQLVSITKDVLPLQNKSAKDIIEQINRLEAEIDSTESQLAIAASPEDYQKLVKAVEDTQQEVSNCQALYQIEQQKS